jgi:hypothetical protein
MFLRVKAMRTFVVAVQLNATSAPVASEEWLPYGVDISTVLLHVACPQGASSCSPPLFAPLRLQSHNEKYFVCLKFIVLKKAEF